MKYFKRATGRRRYAKWRNIVWMSAISSTRDVRSFIDNSPDERFPSNIKLFIEAFDSRYKRTPTREEGRLIIHDDPLFILAIPW